MKLLKLRGISGGLGGWGNLILRHFPLPVKLRASSALRHVLKPFGIWMGRQTGVWRERSALAGSGLLGRQSALSVLNYWAQFDEVLSDELLSSCRFLGKNL